MLKILALAFFTDNEVTSNSIAHSSPSMSSLYTPIEHQSMIPHCALAVPSLESPYWEPHGFARVTGSP